MLGKLPEVGFNVRLSSKSWTKGIELLTTMGMQQVQLDEFGSSSLMAQVAPQLCDIVLSCFINKISQSFCHLSDFGKGQGPFGAVCWIRSICIHCRPAGKLLCSSGLCYEKLRCGTVWWCKMRPWRPVKVGCVRWSCCTPPCNATFNWVAPRLAPRESSVWVFKQWRLKTIQQDAETCKQCPAIHGNITDCMTS